MFPSKLVTLCVIVAVSPLCTSAQREDDYRLHHHHHHHHNRHHRLRSYAKPAPWQISRDGANSDRASSTVASSTLYARDEMSPSPASPPPATSSSAICRREFLRPLEKRIADCDSIFSGTVERIYRSQLSLATSDASPSLFNSNSNSKSPVKPQSEALTFSLDDGHGPPEMMTLTSNLRRNSPLNTYNAPSVTSSEFQAEEAIETSPRESRMRTPAYTRGGGRIHPLLLAQYRQQEQAKARQQETMRGFTRRNSFSHPHQAARQRTQRAETFTHDSHLLSPVSAETYRALIRVKRVIKGDKSIQGKRIIVQGFGSDKICLSNVNEKETKIFLTSTSSALRMKLNSSLLSFTNDNLRKCVVAVKAAAVKMNRLSPEKTAQSRETLQQALAVTSKSNVLMNEQEMRSSVMRATSSNDSQVTSTTAPTTESTDNNVSNKLVNALSGEINKSTILITDESLKNLQSKSLTDELLDNNHHRNHSAIAGGMSEGTSVAERVSTDSSVAVDSDIDFLTDGDILCPVKCNSIGSMVPIACDSISKRCRCKSGVTGLQCDRCSSNHWGFHLIVDENTSCTPCNCNEDGSSDSQCKQSTGKCNCKPGVFGSKCDTCPPGETLSKSGCIPSVTDDYNRFILSNITDLSITSSTVPSSNINDDTINKVDSLDSVQVESKKKKKKGLGKKKNRKKKKSKSLRERETHQLPQ